MLKTLRTARHKRLTEILVSSRTIAGLSQVELAKKLKKPQSFVAKYENRERRLDVIEFCEIAKALGADPRRLLDELLS